MDERELELMAHEADPGTTGAAASHGSAGDGNGWVQCLGGHRHWGRFGAAGLLLHDAGRVLLQHRAEWSHHGGTWGLLGGARDSAESPLHGALREAAEEGGVPPDAVRPLAQYVDDHGGWSYTTVVAAPLRPVQAQALTESLEVAWVPLSRVESRALHPGFAQSWPLLRTALTAPRVVVDAANVFGSRPDGWWRDRAAAATKLRDALVPLATDGLPDEDLPDDLARPPLDRWWPELVLVVEGAARDVTPVDGVAVVPAPASGDDEVVAQVAASDGPVLAVTADRELRGRCRAAGAAVVGPGWLRQALGR